MKRLYYLVADQKHIHPISEKLLAADIGRNNLHVLAKDPAALRGLGLPVANVMHTRDVLLHGERGAILGFAGASLLTLWATSVEPLGAHLGPMFYGMIFAIVNLFGIWVGGLTGLSTTKRPIAALHEEIERGGYLLLVDVSAGNEAAVRNLMVRLHPRARFVQAGSTLDNPFKLKEAQLA